MRISTVIIILLLALVIAAFLGWSRVPDYLAQTLSRKLQVAVQIDDIHLGPTNIEVEHIEIGNTPRSILARAFAAKTIDIKTPIIRYLKDAIVINEIDIDQIYLGLEFNSASSTDGNWTEIMGNLERSLQNTKEQASKKTVLIKKLVLTNIQTDVVYRKEGSRVKRLPTISRIELNNISSEGGFPIDQLTKSVLGQMLQDVFLKQNLQNMLQQLSPLNNLQKMIPGIPIFMQEEKPEDLYSLAAGS